ncbi:hypothetical protein CC78DRAFT_581566 [Lojkania enalia]|uniref:Uncharacterized protein n=1 Tax=Lojkania enalia TaxID=147567 RepID=A0A9P4N2J9_9PLEO|nr:hypothetical protein CC78DRAFT_581566 [Didymosphaeria enalia]
MRSAAAGALPPSVLPITSRTGKTSSSERSGLVAQITRRGSKSWVGLGWGLSSPALVVARPKQLSPRDERSPRGLSLSLPRNPQFAKYTTHPTLSLGLSSSRILLLLQRSPARVPPPLEQGGSWCRDSRSRAVPRSRTPRRERPAGLPSVAAKIFARRWALHEPSSSNARVGAAPGGWDVACSTITHSQARIEAAAGKGMALASGVWIDRGEEPRQVPVRLVSSLVTPTVLHPTAASRARQLSSKGQRAPRAARAQPGCRSASMRQVDLCPQAMIEETARRRPSRCAQRARVQAADARPRGDLLVVRDDDDDGEALLEHRTHREMKGNRPHFSCLLLHHPTESCSGAEKRVAGTSTAQDSASSSSSLVVIAAQIATLALHHEPSLINRKPGPGYSFLSSLSTTDYSHAGPGVKDKPTATSSSSSADSLNHVQQSSFSYSASVTGRRPDVRGRACKPCHHARRSMVEVLARRETDRGVQLRTVSLPS